MSECERLIKKERKKKPSKKSSERASRDDDEYEEEEDEDEGGVCAYHINTQHEISARYLNQHSLQVREQIDSNIR